MCPIKWPQINLTFNYFTPPPRLWKTTSKKSWSQNNADCSRCKLTHVPEPSINMIKYWIYSSFSKTMRLRLLYYFQASCSAHRLSTYRTQIHKENRDHQIDTPLTLSFYILNLGASGNDEGQKTHVHVQEAWFQARSYRSPPAFLRAGAISILNGTILQEHDLSYIQTPCVYLLLIIFVVFFFFVFLRIISLGLFTISLYFLFCFCFFLYCFHLYNAFIFCFSLLPESCHYFIESSCLLLSI